jgi:hypothetical protein
MTEADEREIRSLEFRLSRALDDCHRAQTALSTARSRLGHPDPRAFYTADEMDAANAESRIELRGMVSAVISDCRMRWDRSYTPTPLEKAIAQWPAAFAALGAAKQAKAPAANVVQLPTGQAAQQIIAAGRRRRGETQR